MLFHQVGHERQNCQVAGTFHSGRYPALIFQAVAGNAARKQFALLVDELDQKVGIFVINVFDAEFAKTAVFLAAQTDFRIAQEFYIFS